MRLHDHDHLEPDRPEARARVDQPHPLLLQAAARGRVDVLGPAGMLGVQRTAGNGAAVSVGEQESSPVLDVVATSGQSLDEPVRRDMEARMGQDFSDVRIHTGDAADSSARSVSANAYTVGSNIVFQRGAYDPGSVAGQTLLAHELTHVVQQRNGPVDGTPTGGGVSVSDPSDRFERDAAVNAEQVMAQPAVVAKPTTTAPAPPAGQVQRDEAPGDEEVQTSHDASMPPVQREEAEDEEPTS